MTTAAPITYSIVASPSLRAARRRNSAMRDLPRVMREASASRYRGAMARSTGTAVPVSLAAAERLLRGARVLHTERERRALLPMAQHVGRLDVRSEERRVGKAG